MPASRGGRRARRVSLVRRGAAVPASLVRAWDASPLLWPRCTVVQPLRPIQVRRGILFVSRSTSGDGGRGGPPGLGRVWDGGRRVAGGVREGA